MKVRTTNQKEIRKWLARIDYLQTYWEDQITNLKNDEQYDPEHNCFQPWATNNGQTLLIGCNGAYIKKTSQQVRYNTVSGFTWVYTYETKTLVFEGARNSWVCGNIGGFHPNRRRLFPVWKLLESQHPEWGLLTRWEYSQKKQLEEDRIHRFCDAVKAN